MDMLYQYTCVLLHNKVAYENKYSLYEVHYFKRFYTLLNNVFIVKDLSVI